MIKKRCIILLKKKRKRRKQSRNMDAKMIPPSRNDSPNSPLLYTGNDAKDIRRRGHSTPETGVERWFSVC